MNIALIESKLDGKGGSQRQALSFALAFKKLGHMVTVYTINYDEKKCFSELLAPLNVVALPGGFTGQKPIKIRGFGFLNYLGYTKAENDAVRRLALLIDPNTDILNPHDRLGFRVAAYYKKSVRNIPSVIMMSDILTKSWIAWRKSQFDAGARPGLKQRMFNRLIDWYEVRTFIAPHDGMTVLDNRSREWAQEYFGKDAAVVRSGLDITYFPFVPRHGCSEKRVRILCTGIFFLHRRYEDIIHAVKLLADRGYDPTLSLIGNYTANHEYRTYQKHLHQLARDLGIENRVIYMGEVSEEELRRCYQTHDVYISSNHLQSWGLACFEAMASGMPVIISKTAGASEVLMDGENAILINAKAPQEIADGMCRLVDHPDEYQKLSKAGRAFVEKNISWEHSAKSMLSLFDRVKNMPRIHV